MERVQLELSQNKVETLSRLGIGGRSHLAPNYSRPSENAGHPVQCAQSEPVVCWNYEAKYAQALARLALYIRAREYAKVIHESCFCD
jgi:hypothetical protein